MRFNRSIGKLHGQCYDGASNMSGSRSGVAKRISELEPRAYFTHCYGHALNLAACDTLKKSKVMKDALEERLNYLMIIHVHKERTDALDMKTLLNEFVDKSEHRTRIFARF